MPTHLYDNFAQSWETHGAPYDDTYDVGATFSVGSSTWLDALGYYWRGSGYAVPTQLDLWQRDGATRLEHLTSVPTPTAAGWQWLSLSATRQLTAGHTYSVVQRVPPSSGWADKAGSALPVAPSPFSWGANFRTYEQSPASSLPSNQDASWLVGVDVRTTDPPADEPATFGDVQNAMADWLIATNDNTHQDDGLPWLIRVEAQATAQIVSAILDNFRDANGDVRSVGELARVVSGDVLDALALFFADAPGRLTGGSGGGGSAFTATRQLVVAGPPAVPATGWTLVDETDWTATLAWHVPADVYVVHITDSAGNPVINVAGVDWIPRALWWAELNGTIASERHFTDFEYGQLYLPGRRMSGLLLRGRGDVAGHVQAWIYAAP